jgi:hypothetical protein
VTFPTLPADLFLVPEPSETYFETSVTLIDVIGKDRSAVLGLADRPLRFFELAPDPTITGVATSTIVMF